MIYFAFQSTDADALRATKIGRGGAWEYVAFGGMLFGFVHAAHYTTRTYLDGIDERLMTLPGPANGKLADKHVKHIAAAFPKAKKDDAFSAILLAIYESTGHEGFNPNHH